MSSGIVLVVHFTPQDEHARSKLLNFIDRATENVLKDEPGVLRYARARNVEENDNSVYMVEHYANKAVLDHHTKQPHIQELMAWAASNSSVIKGEVRVIEQIEGLGFTRPEISKHEDPFLVVTDLEYKPGTAESTIPYWKAVFDTTFNDEDGALLWQLARDPENPDKLVVIHAYESEEYLKNVHGVSKALQKSHAHAKDIRILFKLNLLKFEGGFLYRK